MDLSSARKAAETRRGGISPEKAQMLLVILLYPTEQVREYFTPVIRSDIERDPSN